MKKSKKKPMCTVLAMLMIASCLSVLSGCQSNSGTQTGTTSTASSQPSETSAPKDESSEPQSSADESSKVEESSSTETDIKIEDIDWKVSQGIIDNQRYVLLSYTNNSKFTVSDFEITFKEKEDVTEEQKTKFYSDVAKEFGFSDKDMDELKDKEISMHSTSDEVVDPGKSVKNVYCYYYNGYYSVKNMDHYKLVEPDIATIKYINDDKIYTVYYDFKSKSYSIDEQTEEAYKWTRSEAFKNKVPKPDAKTIAVSVDTDSIFMFKVKGVSEEDYDNYVDECIRLRYTVNSSKVGKLYLASDSEGYKVVLNYLDNNSSMSCDFTAPKDSNN